jgi:hypothetical protein
MRFLRKYRFKYRQFILAKTFDIEAFSVWSAMDKFYACYPYAKILKITEVTDESK